MTVVIVKTLLGALGEVGGKVALDQEEVLLLQGRGEKEEEVVGLVEGMVMEEDCQEGTIAYIGIVIV